jgi:hypothetical protein
MKLQLEAYKKKYIVETEYDDVSIDECFELIIGLLMQAGFHKETIDRAIEDLSIAIKEE